MIEQLRQRLQALQKPAGIEDGPSALPLGVAAIDAALGGGLARGALHEIAAPSEAHLAAATGFALGLASPSPRLRGEGGEYRRYEPGEGQFHNALNRGDAPSPARLRLALRRATSPRTRGEVRTSAGSPRTWRSPKAARPTGPASTPSALRPSGC